MMAPAIPRIPESRRNTAAIFGRLEGPTGRAPGPPRRDLIVLRSRNPCGRGLVPRRRRPLGLRRPHELDRRRALPPLLFLLGWIVGHRRLRQEAGILNHTALADATLSGDSFPGGEAFDGRSRSHRSPRGAPAAGRGIPRVPAGRIDELRAL